MRRFLLIIAVLLFFSFRNVETEFKALYLDKIEVTGSINPELPDYVNKLECILNGKTIYQADSLEEFEFNKRPWDIAKQIGKNKYQLLLEINDRPDKNKILLLTIENEAIIKKVIIPTFDKVVKNEAGYKEFAGELEYAEALDNTKKTQYIPTLFYKDKETGLELDTTRTINYNISKWGKFYGYKPNFKLLLIPRKVE